MGEVSMFIDGMAFDSPHRNQDDHPQTVHVVVRYGQKEARIELPAGVPRSDEERKGTTPHLRELRELVEALQDAVESPQELPWRGPHHQV